MKNVNKFLKDSNLGIAVPVPVNSVGGDLVLLGADGLRGLLKNDRATTEKIAAGLSAPGLKNGQATVYLLGISIIATFTIATDGAQFAAVYKLADGTYSKDKNGAGAVKVGFFIDGLAAAGKTRIALLPSA